MCCPIFMSLGVCVDFGCDIIGANLSPPLPLRLFRLSSATFITAVISIKEYIGEFSQNVKLLFKLSFVHFCEESRGALVFYGYFAISFFFLGLCVMWVGQRLILNM